MDPAMPCPTLRVGEALVDATDDGLGARSVGRWPGGAGRMGTEPEDTTVGFKGGFEIWDGSLDRLLLMRISLEKELVGGTSKLVLSEGNVEEAI